MEVLSNSLFFLPSASWNHDLHLHSQVHIPYGVVYFNDRKSCLFLSRPFLRVRCGLGWSQTGSSLSASAPKRRSHRCVVPHQIEITSFLLLLETGFLCAALVAVLELDLDTRLALNSQRSSCLCLLDERHEPSAIFHLFSSPPPA